MDPKHGSKCQGEKNEAKGTLQKKELQHYSCKLSALITMGICDIRVHYSTMTALNLMILAYMQIFKSTS
jgi:hypothetical protein